MSHWALLSQPASWDLHLHTHSWHPTLMGQADCLGILGRTIHNKAITIKTSFQPRSSADWVILQNQRKTSQRPSADQVTLTSIQTSLEIRSFLHINCNLNSKYTLKKKKKCKKHQPMRASLTTRRSCSRYPTAPAHI